MLKAVLIFLVGIFCGFWFSWLAPQSLINRWRGSGNGTSKSYFEQRDEDFHYGKEEGVLRKQLADQVRVLCMVVTERENHYKTVHIKATWGKRCNILLFLSTVENETVPIITLPVAEDEDFERGMTKESFKYVYNEYLKDNTQQVDWVLKTDDKTYVVVENLRFFLSSFSPEEAVYFGRNMKSNGTLAELDTETYGYMDGDAGYVLSREAVRRFAVEGLEGKKICRENEILENDLEMGKCMNLLKVKAGNSKDSLGRGRFFPLKPSDHVNLQLKNKSWSFSNYLFIEGGGLDCCSDLAITFHRISTSYMHTLEYLLYHLHPYGINHSMTARPYLDSAVGSNNSALID